MEGKNGRIGEDFDKNGRSGDKGRKDPISNLSRSKGDGRWKLDGDGYGGLRAGYGGAVVKKKQGRR